MAGQAYTMNTSLSLGDVRIFTSSGNITMGNEGALVVKKTSGAATQVTLPSSPAANLGGNFRWVIDGKGDAATNNITIVAASGNIAGAASYVISENYGSVLLFYPNGGTEWLLATPPLSLASVSGLLATAAEINRVADLSTRIVDVTASTLSATLAAHDGKTVTLNQAAGIAVTLPAATGTGARLRFVIGTTVTSNTTTFTRAGSDVIHGHVVQLADGGSTLAAYEMPGSTVLTLNGTTQGGTKGDIIEFEDIAAATWWCRAVLSATGTEATPVT